MLQTRSLSESLSSIQYIFCLYSVLIICVILCQLKYPETTNLLLQTPSLSESPFSIEYILCIYSVLIISVILCQLKYPETKNLLLQTSFACSGDIELLRMRYMYMHFNEHELCSQIMHVIKSQLHVRVFSISL